MGSVIANANGNGAREVLWSWAGFCDGADLTSRALSRRCGYFTAMLECVPGRQDRAPSSRAGPTKTALAHHKSHCFCKLEDANRARPPSSFSASKSPQTQLRSDFSSPLPFLHHQPPTHQSSASRAIDPVSLCCVPRRVAHHGASSRPIDPAGSPAPVRPRPPPRLRLDPLSCPLR